MDRHNKPMKTSYKTPFRAIPFIFLMLSCFAFSQEAFPLQIWKNKDGKTVEASLYAIAPEEKIVIKLKNSIKHTISKNSLSEETLAQLNETIISVKSQWHDKDLIPTAALAHKAAALGLPQRTFKKTGQYEFLKVVDFYLQTHGKGALVLLEKGIAVELLPTKDSKFGISGVNLTFQRDREASAYNKKIMATKGTVYAMDLSGPLRWGRVGVNDCAIFTKLVD
jgi:hypothetical protein